MMLLYTYYEPLFSEGEINSGKVEVEQVHIDHNELIESFIYAGERLNAARAEAYDYADEKSADEGEIDPTRSGGFDFADVTAAVAGIRARKAAADKEIEDAAASAKLQEPLVEK